MTAIAELNIIPVRKESMSGEIAKAVEALEAFDITYETTPMGTILEADDVHELFVRFRSTSTTKGSISSRWGRTAGPVSNVISSAA